MEDREVILYLRERAADKSNRLADKHIDTVQKRLQERLNVSEQAAPPPKTKSNVVRNTGVSLLVIGLTVSGQVDLVELIYLLEHFIVSYEY